jgi:hypothetical protein
MDFVHIAISARLAHGDLVAADAALEDGPTDDGIRLILVKQLLVSCANVTDLELMCRTLYKGHPALSEIITPHRRNFEFAKYIRNIAVGHVNSELSQKTLEWRPECPKARLPDFCCSGKSCSEALSFKCGSVAVNTS